MAIYKCKMCGGDIHPQEGVRLITCEYCGTTQTVCQIDDSRIANMFNRANEQRLNNEFDKAESLYESIINENPQESEAYWGKLLCKYGIEYVDDPLTGKKIPTCHRTIYESIYDDLDYNRAINNADSIAEKQYHEEAKEIDRLQKKILDVASKEEPYDVFICYKETDDSGERTKDSLYAENLYNALTEKGYRVFFSRITLESKLGTEYEPVIFAALQTAKVMLVVGTKYDYMNSVWVKNEWKRYFELVKKENGSRTIIPCYADMEPIDLPKEFVALQGQDLTKIGAIQDVIRGVRKILDASSVGRIDSSHALDVLMNERNAREKKKRVIKRILKVSVPVMIVLIALMVFFVRMNLKEDGISNNPVKENVTDNNMSQDYLNNSDIVEDGIKYIEVDSGIPDSDEYDFFSARLTLYNVEEYFTICKQQWTHETDDGERIKEGVFLDSNCYDQGWYIIDKYEGSRNIYSTFGIRVTYNVGTNARNRVVEKTVSPGNLLINYAYDRVNMPIYEKVSGEALYVSKDFVENVEYKDGKRYLKLKDGTTYEDSWQNENILPLGHEY